jgi:eukaryotic-like serine/threonine-protein kinase
MAEILDTLQTTLAGKYRVERELGRGGMATVYYGHDLANDREVAIKVLNPDLSATIGADRFSREIQLASRLVHPHILGLYESGTADKLLYYVMPFVRGESVRDKLNREGQLSVNDAVRIIREVADALGYAHAQDVVHRDIKPENILLLESGQALVADFGIAKAATEGDAQKLTQTGMAVGTPVYMSPEQSTGEKVGPAADIYSLGCVLYEMLAGDPPFTGKNAMAIMARHAMDTVPSIRIVRSAVPEEVEEAIFAAMEKSPVDRPRSCAEFLDILGTPLGETAMRRATRMTSTRRIPTPPPEPPAPPPTPWYRKPALVGGLVVALAGTGFAAWKFGGGGATPAMPVNSKIAVLYFDDDTKGEFGYLADGLTDALIGSLSGVSDLNVVSRGGVDQFRGDTASDQTIAARLDAGFLVRGAVAKDGEKLQVSVRLVDGVSGETVERARVTQAGRDPLLLRDSLAVKVAELIRQRVGKQITLKESREGTRNEQAWTLLQLAEAARKRGEAAGTSDRAKLETEFQRADSLLVASAGLDARWAEPMVARSRLAYRRARLNQADIPTAKLWADSAVVHAEAALLRSANNPDALEMRGTTRYFMVLAGMEPEAAKQDGIVRLAQADLEAATKANPTQAGAWASLSALYYRTGSNVDVNLAARKALEADAYLANADVVLNRLFLSSYDLGKFTPDGVRWCDQLNERFGQSANAARCRLMLLTTRDQQADVAKAWAYADTAVMRAPKPQQPLQRLANNMYVAAVLARAGMADSARKVTAASQGDEQLDPTRDLMLRAAFVHTLLSDTTSAVKALKVYFAANDARRANYADDPGWWFRPIAGSGAYRQLVGSSQ